MSETERDKCLTGFISLLLVLVLGRTVYGKWTIVDNQGYINYIHKSTNKEIKIIEKVILKRGFYDYS